MPKNKLFTEDFSNIYSKLDKNIKTIVDKSIEKILNKPELGKPLKYSLHGLRSERIGTFRLIYEIKGEFIVFHSLEHRKKVYK